MNKGGRDKRHTDSKRIYTHRLWHAFKIHSPRDSLGHSFSRKLNNTRRCQLASGGLFLEELVGPAVFADRGPLVFLIPALQTILHGDLVADA